MELLDPHYAGPRTHEYAPASPPKRQKTSSSGGGNINSTNLSFAGFFDDVDMELLAPSAGSGQDEQNDFKSSSLPFGRHVPLAQVKDASYLTAQTVVQQTAYALSDKVYTYSPETFDLDVALRNWHGQRQQNAHGYTPGVHAMDIRAGAGNVALGYMFSKDFDMAKRHIPQTIVASSGSLQQLQPALTELSLLYSLANPVVAHVAAADYSASSRGGLITDYASVMAVAEEAGLGLVSSVSAFEVQHMALFATALAKVLPTIHTYDGINIGHETTKVPRVLDSATLQKTLDSLSAVAKGFSRRLNDEAKVALLLEAFNRDLLTDYKPFEYFGHSEPEAVLVVFGSVEGSLAAQLAAALGAIGAKIGAVNVRVYRPFLDEEFLNVLPKSVRHVAVLGQVKSAAAVADKAETSRLYSDVLAAVSFATKFNKTPRVSDVKYATDEVWTPSKMLSGLQHITQFTSAPQTWIKPSDERPSLEILPASVKRYTFWDLDDSPAVATPVSLARILAGDSAEHVSLRTRYDNLTEGGVARSDIRSSTKAIEAPYPVSAAMVSYVGDEKLLKNFDVCASLREGGSLLVNLPGSKTLDAEKLEKRFPEQFRQSLLKKGAQLYILDSLASEKAADNTDLSVLLLQLAFLRLADSSAAFANLQKLAISHGYIEALGVLSNDLDSALWAYEIPEGWKSTEVEGTVQQLPSDLNATSFTGYDKVDKSETSFLKSWTVAAKGLAFKEATGTRTALRPDAGVTTYTVHVKEHRRLTPLSYDRNVFHIEFDLGTSGLQYKIGEALGIHAENDKAEVEEFIQWYGLAADDVVEVPSRESPAILENRTVYQSLMQNLDIFGRPPKRFYESLAEFATDENQRKELLTLGGPEGANEFKRRSDVDTVTFADVLREFSSAHPPFHDLARIVSPMKRREYSIASSQKVHPNSVCLLIVTVGWVDPTGRDRFGQATRYLNALPVGAPVTVSVKPSVMQMPKSTTAPLIMAGLGTGLAPFRAFVQERAYQKAQGAEIGPILLFMGSRHQREEYLYGEEWEAYLDAGIITTFGRAFSRDQAQKIYIQDRMRESLEQIRTSYLSGGGSFFLCGPTWPVPDVTEVLQEAIEVEQRALGKKVDGRREIEAFKDEGRYVLEVY